jgi:uncharacterized protein YndB with AHSA1/START domain
MEKITACIFVVKKEDLIFVAEQMTSTTQNSRIIHASPEIVYHAFTDPGALEQWMAPGDMTGKVHNFKLLVGGGYEMSLYYSGREQGARGKTTGKEDRFTARFIELIPFTKIAEAINFESPNPEFAGEMIMEVILEPVNNATKVTILFKNIPRGIDPKDNEKGTELSLEKLARYVE